MKLAMDSSALAKRYVTEGGGDRIDQLLQNASRLAICIIAVPEIVSGLNRRLREERLSENEYRQVKGALLSDVRDTVVLQITPAVVSRSVTLLENNPLRAMDALHIAAAVEWEADLFVTADRRQFLAAKRAGQLAELVGRAE